MEYFDVRNFGAQFAYTMDGGAPNEIENETFCADFKSLGKPLEESGRLLGVYEIDEHHEPDGLAALYIAG